MKPKLLFISIASIALLWLSCSNNSSNDEQSYNALGEEKFHLYCASCHNNSGTIAPPPFAIQKHYKMKYGEEAVFAEKIAAYVSHPSKDSALLSPAVWKFGLMPAMSYPKEELLEIAKFIFHAEFEKPNHNRNEDQFDQKQKGAEIARNAKQLLGINLMQKLNEGSTIEALDFCNLHAVSLTDSVSKTYETFIQRVSNKPRNPENQASESEIRLILAYQKQLDLGEEPKPQIYESEGKSWFYAPIETNQMCLQCHGVVGENIKPEVQREINKRYLNDQAIGYSENQIRGLMKVEIK